MTDYYYGPRETEERGITTRHQEASFGTASKIDHLCFPSEVARDIEMGRVRTRLAARHNVASAVLEHELCETRLQHKLDEMCMTVVAKAMARTELKKAIERGEKGGARGSLQEGIEELSQEIDALVEAIKQLAEYGVWPSEEILVPKKSTSAPQRAVKKVATTKGAPSPGGSPQRKEEPESVEDAMDRYRRESGGGGGWMWGRD